ncbi:hypothetical protein C9J60_39285, partial [Streptomyces sp. A244]|uniref:hypothetical protein n=1 Tax=Streptomyces sp. A244 TaxID=2137016 RepID=UPI000D41AE68
MTLWRSPFGAIENRNYEDSALDDIETELAVALRGDRGSHRHVGPHPRVAVPWRSTCGTTEDRNTWPAGAFAAPPVAPKMTQERNTFTRLHLTVSGGSDVGSKPRIPSIDRVVGDGGVVAVAPRAADDRNTFSVLRLAEAGGVGGPALESWACRSLSIEDERCLPDRLP